MFPYLKVALSGLQKDELYTVKVEMLLLDTRKYRFSSQQWNPTDCEVSDFPEKQRYVHPHSPAFGTQWMLCPVSFKHMKLTNDPHRGGAEDVSHSHFTSPNTFFYQSHFYLLDSFAAVSSLHVQVPSKSDCHSPFQWEVKVLQLSRDHLYCSDCIPKSTGGEMGGGGGPLVHKWELDFK